MIDRLFLRLATVVVCSTLLSACSVLSFGSSDRAEKELADREGRIAMVLADEALEASPELAGVTVTLPDPVSVSAWSQAGSNAAKVPGHVLAAPDMTVAWRTNAGQGSNLKSALIAVPVTSETHIFMVDSGQTVRAFDLATGAEVWTRPLVSLNPQDTIGIGAGIAYDQGRVFVASGYGFVTALDALTGARYWRSNMESPMTGAPTVKDGRVFVSSNNNDIFALSAENGSVLWSDQAIAEPARVLGSPSVAAVEDIVIAPYSSGEIIAYLAANGRRLWNDALASPGQFTPISAINDIGARPVLGRGLVYAVSQSGVLAAIDGRTGNRVWQQPLGSIQAPALVGSYLFAVSVDAELACFDAGTGQVVWVSQLEQFEKVEKKEGRITYSGPIVASGRVVVVSSRGDVLAFDPQTGTETARLKLGSAVFIEPIAAQDKLFVLTDDARLIAIR